MKDMYACFPRLALGYAEQRRRQQTEPLPARNKGLSETASQARIPRLSSFGPAFRIITNHHYKF